MISLPLSKRLAEAVAFASRAHGTQTRKQTEVPYIAHLLAVTAIVLEHGGDEDQAIAALLHDTIEDCGGEPVRKQIRRDFGERVASIVDACTDTDENPKPPWRERKEAYIEHIALAPREALLVSMADKLHNVRSILADHQSIGDAVWTRFGGGKDGSLWYYASLVEAFRARDDSALLRELDRAVFELVRAAGSTPKH